LAVALVLPLAAAPAAVTGDMTVGWIGDFGTTTGFTGDVNIYVKAAVDDYNSVAVTVGRALKTFVTAADFTAETVTTAAFEDMVLDALTLTTDVGKFLKIDPKMVAWTVTTGYTSSADNSYISQSGYGVEDVGGVGTATAWEAWTWFKFVDLVQVKFGIVPTTIISGGTVDMIVGAYLSKALGTIGTLNAEVFWDNLDEIVEFDTRFDLTPAKDLTIGIGAGVKYDITAPASYMIGASLKGKYGTMGDLAVGFDYASAAADYLAAQLTISALQPFDIYAGLKLDLSGGGATVFHSADIAAKLNLGAADIYVGYSLGNGVVAPTVRWAPVALGLDGGLYVKFYTAF
jgi:hypothetical protein